MFSSTQVAVGAGLLALVAVGTAGVAAATSDFTAMNFDESQVFVYIAVEAYCAQHMEVLS
jgi:hypothetical protein